MTAVAAHSLTCPSCGGTIAIKAAGYSVSVACQYCGSILDVTNPDVRIIEEYTRASMDGPIPLNSRGTLAGIEWEAIGYLARRDLESTWCEYLLFNPYGGYRWLVYSEGSWQFGTMLLDQPDGNSDTATWRGHRFNRDYPPVTTTTDRVVGEFYWRVRAGDAVTAMTYSRGDETLSVEWGEDETNWTQLVELSPSQVMAAFGTGQTAEDQGAHTSSPPSGLLSRSAANYQAAEGMAKSDLSRMFTFAIGTSFLILVIMLFFGRTTAHIQGPPLTLTVDGPERSQTIGTLSVTQPYQFVTVTARSSEFVNRWVDLDYSLVNRQTQQSIDATSTVEYYQGQDSDGDWTEGNHNSTAKFAGVPSGSYDVVVDASAHSWSDPASPSTTSSSTTNPWSAPETVAIQIDAATGGVLWGNYITFLIFLFGLPIIIAWYRRRK